MKKENLTQEQYNKLMDAISPILLDNGPSRTTMDLVASRLGMSKRTLYEIFDSKDDLLKSVLTYLHNIHIVKITKLLNESDNMMEAIGKVMFYHQKNMIETNPVFYHDMDERYRHIRKEYDHNSSNWIEDMHKAVKIGIRQGVFRSHVNYPVALQLFRIQLESLKRMEEHFPAEITLAEASESIIQGFLRSIATDEGHKVLDKLEIKYSKQQSTI